MIDFKTYKLLHSNSAGFMMQYGRGREEQFDMDPSFMERGEPPLAPDLYLFPDSIIGFDLRRKKLGES